MFKNGSGVEGRRLASKPPVRWQREARGYLEALAIAFLFITFVFNTVGVVGASMLPTLDGGPGSTNMVRSLLTGDRVLVSKYHNWLVRVGAAEPYRPGDVVVHRSPRSSYDYALRTGSGCFESLLVNRCRPFLIKRIVAGPGDTLSIDAGRVIVNGSVQDQAFITEGGLVEVEPVNFPVVMVEDEGAIALQVGWLTATTDVRVPVLPTTESPTGFTSLGNPTLRQYYSSIIDNLVIPADAEAGEAVLASIVVPEHSYFVLGDNRSSGGSLDSRAFGLIPAIDVAGPATAIIWPPRRSGEWNWGGVR